MKPSVRVLLVCLGLMPLALIGCQAADEAPPLEELAIASPAPANPQPAASLPQEQPADPAAPAVASAEEEFTPPFPDRVDFFVAPRRARAAQRGDEVVELRGFITPPDDRGTRVLLAINGTESPIAAGEEKMGVRVISIEQPKVVLQRGRNRWTETLE